MYSSPMTRDEFDALHAASGLLSTLNASAFGPVHVAEVDPFGWCSSALLDFAVGHLPLGGQLIDLGCGRGGPGLHVAERLGMRITGIDFSEVALNAAAQRIPDGLRGRASFLHGELTETGLADSSADGLISFNALPYAKDRLAALKEIGRVLKPGGSAVLTVSVNPRRAGRGLASWRQFVEDAGLNMLDCVAAPAVGLRWSALYRLWTQHADTLIGNLGSVLGHKLLAEAAMMPPLLSSHRDLVLVLVRPE